MPVKLIKMRKRCRVEKGEAMELPPVLAIIYDDRYSLNLSFRADASANFGPNNKWVLFPKCFRRLTVTN